MNNKIIIVIILAIFSALSLSTSAFAITPQPTEMFWPKDFPDTRSEEAMIKRKLAQLKWKKTAEKFLALSLSSTLSK